MKCPVDNAVLVLADKSGIEIDYCPTCRGVWLDRGELDKIVARMAAEAAPAVALSEPRRAAAHKDDRRYHEDDDDRRDGRDRRRNGLLGELFDF